MIKPILFNTQMVQAIQDKRKKVTRRLVKLPKHIEKDSVDGIYTLYADGTNYQSSYLEEFFEYIYPKYNVGDILWVTETWRVFNTYENAFGFDVLYKADDKIISCSFKESDRYLDKFAKYESKNGWQSPYFMPKEAARIFLRVTGVKVERLQDITEAQIVKEGINPYDEICHDINWKPTYNDPDSGGSPNLMQGWEILWNSTVKENWQKFDENPWVCVIEFERCEKPEGWGE